MSGAFNRIQFSIASLPKDCHFKIENEIISAHRVVLANASSVFAAMFNGPMAEHNGTQIEIEDIEAHVFQLLIDYIYTGIFYVNNCETAYELYYAAHKYMLENLLKFCRDYISENMNISSAARCLEFCYKFNDWILGEKCIEMIIYHTLEVISSNEFNTLHLSTVKLIYDLDHMAIQDELVLFNAAVRYAKAQVQKEDYNSPWRKLINACSKLRKIMAQKEKRNEQDENEDSIDETYRGDISDHPEVQEIVRSLIPKIRFLTLEYKEFANGPCMTNFLTPDEKLSILYNIAHRKSVPVPNVPMPDDFHTVHTKRSLPAQVNCMFGEPNEANNVSCTCCLQRRRRFSFRHKMAYWSLFFLVCIPYICKNIMQGRQDGNFNINTHLLMLQNDSHNVADSYMYI